MSNNSAVVPINLPKKESGGGLFHKIVIIYFIKVNLSHFNFRQTLQKNPQIKIKK